MPDQPPRLRIRFEFDGRHTLGPGKVQLLEAVGELGSISWRAPFFGVAVLMSVALVATAVLLYAVDATLADATGIVLVRGPSIVSRAALAYGSTVDDGTKIAAKLTQLAAVGIIARDGVCR